MKLVVAGGRDIFDVAFIHGAINDYPHVIDMVITGGASGVDAIAHTIAREHGLPTRVFPADWRLGRRAGPLRNKQMAEEGDALLAIWDGASRGTKNMIDEMRALGKPVVVVIYPEKD